jgi:ATP-dependent RNA helicase DDX47/RRP3
MLAQRQSSLFVPHRGRDITLAYLCNEICAADHTVAIFARTVLETNRVANLLGRFGVGAISLHVGLSPSARVAALNSRVIVTTDAAACLIPLRKVDYIINFDLTSCSWKMKPDTYTQRIGNVAFAGGLCCAMTFCTQ